MAPKRSRTIPGSSSFNQNRTQEHDEMQEVPVFRFQDNDQRSRYEGLRQRTMLPTRYLDLEIIRTLGLRNDLDYMLNNAGWMRFGLECTEVVYPRLVLEFLSSLYTEILNGPNCEEGLIVFRLFNCEHRLTIAEFNAIFGFPQGGNRRTPRSFDADRFWTTLTGERNWRAGKCNSSSFRHPLIRILHRFIASTILGRGDSEGKVRLTDLLLLWALVEGRCDSIDSGSYLARQFQAIANSDAGLIVNGGLITTIALHLGYRRWVEQLDVLEGGTRTIGLSTLISMKCVVKEVDDSYWFLMAGQRHRLPAPAYAIREGTFQFPSDDEADDASFGEAAEEAGPSQQQQGPVPLEEQHHEPAAYPAVTAYQILAAIQNVDNRVQQMDERQQQYNQMIDHMYHWHMRHHPDDFPPQ